MSIFFCLQGCSKKNEIGKNKGYEFSEEECSLLDKFFRYLLLNESGAYTLLGTKPLTDVYICCETLEDQKERWDRLSEDEKLERVLILNQDDFNDMDFYQTLSEKVKKNAILVPERDYVFSLKEFIDNWSVIEKISISPKYLLIRKQVSPNQIFRIVFVNVVETASVIQKHYKIFRDVVGFDFDPFSVVLELKKPKSLFWEKLGESGGAYTWGLLYGFGERNAFFYSSSEERPSFNGQTFNPLPSTENVLLPSFISFSKDDPIVKRYEKERVGIKKAYEGKNFVHQTLLKLAED